MHTLDENIFLVFAFVSYSFFGFFLSLFCVLFCLFVVVAVVLPVVSSRHDILNENRYLFSTGLGVSFRHLHEMM